MLTIFFVIARDTHMLHHPTACFIYEMSCVVLKWIVIFNFYNNTTVILYSSYVFVLKRSGKSIVYSTDIVECIQSHLITDGLTQVIYSNNEVYSVCTSKRHIDIRFIHRVHYNTIPLPICPVCMYVISKLKSHVWNIPEASFPYCVHDVLAPFGIALTWSVRVLARIDLIVGPPPPSTPRHKKSTDGPRLGPETAPRSTNPSLHLVFLYLPLVWIWTRSMFWSMKHRN